MSSFIGGSHDLCYGNMEASAGLGPFILPELSIGAYDLKEVLYEV